MSLVNLPYLLLITQALALPTAKLESLTPRLGNIGGPGYPELLPARRVADPPTLSRSESSTANCASCHGFGGAERSVGDSNSDTITIPTAETRKVADGRPVGPDRKNPVHYIVHHRSGCVGDCAVVARGGGSPSEGLGSNNHAESVRGIQESPTVNWDCATCVR